MTGDNASLLLWEKLKPMVDREIAEKTAGCLRMKKMVITTAYNATTKKVGVSEAFGDEMFLPVMSDMTTSLLIKGKPVWVLIPFGDLSNSIIMMRGDGAR